MNPAQLHLAINHLPVVTFLLGTGFFTFSFVCCGDYLRKSGLILLVLGGLFSVPTYLSGEPSEDTVEKVANNPHDFIEEHEESAQYSLAFSIVTALAALSILGLKRCRNNKALAFGVLGLSVVTTATFMRTAHLGGLIRHDEIRSGAPATTEHLDEK